MDGRVWQQYPGCGHRCVHLYLCTDSTNLFSLTGVPVTEKPDFSYVCLRDGTVVYPRRVITDATTKPGIVDVQEEEFVQQEFKDLTPENIDVTPGLE